ncbi:MBL fold metallo-hydrolase [Vibrio parahaemolyticus]
MHFHKKCIGLIVWFFMAISLLTGCTQALQPSSQEAQSVSWYDDYFTIEFIDSQTIAIGEPRYHQQNYSYLILGETRALLVDSGPGIKDIKPVVESLTKLPITVTQTHFHYDHVGNHKQFDHIAATKLPSLDSNVENGRIKIDTTTHLGFVENIEKPELLVNEWWEVGQEIDLGGRVLTVLHSPGHAKESVVLADQQRGYLFTGDFLCPGPNLAALPGADIEDYLISTNSLLALSTSETILLTGHRDKDSIELGVPTLTKNDLNDFRIALEKIIDGTLDGQGFYINVYKVNERIDFIVDK